MSDITEQELSELQRLISTAYDYGLQCADRGRLRIESCIEAGRKFTEIKRRLGHGKWGRWIEANLTMAETTTRNWMRLAKAHEEGILDLTSAGGIRKAFQLAGIIPDSDGSKASTQEPQELYMLHATRLDASLSRLDVVVLSDDMLQGLLVKLDKIGGHRRRIVGMRGGVEV